MYVHMLLHAAAHRVCTEECGEFLVPYIVISTKRLIKYNAVDKQYVQQQKSETKKTAPKTNQKTQKF